MPFAARQALRRAALSQAHSTPEISVLMTIFNTEPYLAEAIDSVLHQQTARTFELLLVDDGSTDGSLAIAQRYAAHHSDCIRVLRHPGGRNCGISASRNLALRHARGEVIAFLDSDDVWLPHHLEVQANRLQRAGAAAMVYAGAERWVDSIASFDEAKARAATWGCNYLPPLVPVGERAGLLPRGALLHWFLRDESMVPCICTVLVRAEAARAVGGFCDDFRGLYDDQAFHAKIALHYDVYAHDVCVARYRQHPASTCAQGAHDEALRRTERERFLSFLEQQQRALDLSSSLLAQS